MCAVEPIPLMLEAMKNPKLVSLVSEARKGQGVHNYIKGVCMQSPAKIMSSMRQFYPDTVVKVTAVNYVLEDNPEFRLHAADDRYKELNFVLKNSNITIDYNSTYEKDPAIAHLKVNNKFPLKKGDYIVASISCNMVDKTPCQDYETCTSIGSLQFEFNGVQLPGDIRLTFMNLNTLFIFLEISGLGQRTSSRELHWLYNNVTDSISFDTLPRLYELPFIQLRAKNDYLWAGDWAVLTGKFKNMTPRFKGIAVGVSSNYTGDSDLKDFDRYKDYAGTVTFYMTVTINATVISTEDEVKICTKITAGIRCLIPSFQNMYIDNFETHVMTWPSDEW